MDFGVGFDQLSCQRTVDAAPLAIDGVDVGNVCVGPRLQRFEAVQAAELWLTVKLPDVVAACG